MIGSLFAGVSGLNANATAMSVIGDNIANVNTTAFKSNRASFANILSQSLEGSTGNNIGRGVEFWGTSPVWSQGSLETTNNPTDLAINGRGFFIVKHPETGKVYYTRAGEFRFDKVGNLANADGLVVQGWNLAEGQSAPGPTENINIPGGSTSSPKATKTLTAGINLDAGKSTGSEADPSYSTSLTVYDSLGNDIVLQINFWKKSEGTWGWKADVPKTIGSVTQSSEELKFSEDGTLEDGTDPEIEIELTNGAKTPQTITWDLYDDDTGKTNGDVTQYSSPCTTTFQTQDGRSAGTLQSISVDEEGVITGVYSNGETKPLYQIALVDFQSYWGLARTGKNLYSESLASGQPVKGTAGSGSLGTISANSLEMSNVDLASEFVKMITTQRAFQANSRVITTSDEILADLISIKR